MAQEDQTTTIPASSTDGVSSVKSNNGNGNGNGNGAPKPAAPDAGPAPAAQSKPNPILFIVLAILIIVGGIVGFNYWVFSQNHVSTDDAYVTGDLINVSPIVSGTLKTLNVEEGDSVKQGQIIAQLDDSGPRASYEQALAAYNAAKSQVPQAETNLSYESANVDSQIKQAEAALGAQQAKTRQSQQQIGLISATTSGQLLQAEAQYQTAIAQAQNAEAQARSARQAVAVAQASAASVNQQVQVAQANATKSQRDAARYASLYGANGEVAAVTIQQLDQVNAAATSANAQLQSARDQAAQANSQVQQAMDQARAAFATASAALKQVQAANAAVAIAKANQIQVPVQRFGAQNNSAIVTQNEAELTAAKANLKQIELRRQQVLTAQAQADQSQAAVTAAKVTLDDCTIAAASDGVVVKKAVNVGDALSAGQTIVTMTRSNTVWVSANFKETQLENVRPGQPADIEVDAFPGITFKGKVLSVNAASGNTTSLLPADNATGNFTKVVQRIPVKIALIPASDGDNKKTATAEDIANLRQGMSVVATIDVSSARNKQ